MRRRYAYGVGIAVIGAVLAVVQALHGLQQSNRLLVLAFEAAPFVLLSLAIVYTGSWLARTEEYEAELPRIIAWGVGTTILFASIAALMLFSQQVEMGTLERASFIAIDLVTIGALSGVLVGLYDAQGQMRRRDLRRERDRVETFANKAADVNNYGRALNRSQSVHDVSGLVVEAMSSLLDVTESAVIVGNGNFEMVDNTVDGVAEEALADLAEQTLDESEASFVVHEDVPPRVAERDVSAVSLLLLSGDEHSVVLVALDENPPVRDEDLELVEMLASHASTALTGILDSDGDTATRTQSA